MKKIILAFLLALPLVFFVPSSSFPAEANSAPTYSAGVVEEGIIVLDASPVEVKKETLTFSVPSLSSRGECSLTARYVFSNPTDMDVSARVVFPVTIHRYGEMSYIRSIAEYEVLLNDQVIDKKCRCTYFCGSFDYKKDARRLSDEYVSSDYLEDDFFRPETEVYIYRCKVEGYSNIEYTVTLPDQKERGRRVMIPGVCVDRTTDGDVVAEVFEKEFQLFSFGGPLDETPVIDVYRKGTSKTVKIKKQPTFELERQTTFLGYVAEKYDKDIFSLTDRYNAIVVGEKEFPYPRDRSEDMGVYCRNFVVDEAMCVLCWYEYDVLFPRRSEMVNVVTAPLVGSVKNNRSQARYEYLWSPAKEWASFSDLTVNIVTPYVLDEELTPYDFEKTETGYTMHLNSLPEEDELVFYLRVDTSGEENGRNIALWLSKQSKALTVVLGVSAGIIIAIIVVVIALVVRAKRR